MRGDLLGAEEVAAYLGVGQVTVYRWCREGRLPCTKIGKSWRIHREALDDFLEQGRRPTSLAGHLRSFLTVPDNILGIAADHALLHRLDVAFFKVGEARGGLLVKFHGGESEREDRLRASFEEKGLDVARLEEEDRFRFGSERDPLDGREDALRGIIAENADAGRTIWASFDWREVVDLDMALEQQQALTTLVDSNRLVVKTAALETVIDAWPAATLRRAQVSHSGMIWLSEDGLASSRVTPLPPE